MKRLCLYGGAFDPVHNGHIHFAKAIVANFKPDTLYFIPAAHSPFKHGIKHAEDRHRLNMLSIAARSVPDSRVSRVEIERKGLSYTLDTLKYFHAAYPGSRLYWVIGDDNLDMLDKWKGYPEHFRYAGFIVLPRRHEEDLQERIDAHPYGDRLHPLDAGILPLASTDIRRRIARGEPVSGLLPGAVNDYIQKNGLYR